MNTIQYNTNTFSLIRASTVRLLPRTSSSLEQRFERETVDHVTELSAVHCVCVRVSVVEQAEYASATLDDSEIAEPKLLARLNECGPLRTQSHEQ